MYSDYYISASGGFTDEARLYDLWLTTLLGGGLICLCLMVAGLCAFVAFRRTLRQGADISDKLDCVASAISGAATGSQLEVAGHAQAVLEADSAAFDGFNAFACLLEDRTKALSKALSPTAERDETAAERKRRQAAGLAGTHTGANGTVINIAVMQSGQMVPPVSEAHRADALPVPGGHETCFPLSKAAQLWLRLQQLAELWRDKVLTGAYYQAAQAQLLRAEVWAAPDDPAPSRRSGHTHVS